PAAGAPSQASATPAMPCSHAHPAAAASAARQSRTSAWSGPAACPAAARASTAAAPHRAAVRPMATTRQRGRLAAVQLIPRVSLCLLLFASLNAGLNSWSTGSPQAVAAWQGRRVSWEEELFGYLDDLEGQAAALYDADRAPDIADRGRAEY